VRPLLPERSFGLTLSPPTILLHSPTLFEFLYFLPLLTGIKKALPDIILILYAPSEYLSFLSKQPIVDTARPVEELKLPYLPPITHLGSIPLDNYTLAFSQFLDDLGSKGIRLPRHQPEFTTCIVPQKELLSRLYGGSSRYVILDLPQELISPQLSALISNASLRCLSLQNIHLNGVQLVSRLDPSEQLSLFLSCDFAITSSIDLLLARAFTTMPTVGLSVEMDNAYLKRLPSPPSCYTTLSDMLNTLPYLLDETYSPLTITSRSSDSYAYTVIGKQGVRFKIDSTSLSLLPPLQTSALLPTGVFVILGTPKDFSPSLNYAVTHIGVWLDPDPKSFLNNIHKCLYLDRLLVFSDDSVLSTTISELVPQTSVYSVNKFVRLIEILRTLLLELQSLKSKSKSLFVVPQTFGDAFLCRGIIGALSLDREHCMDVLTKEMCAPFFLGDQHIGKLILYPAHPVRPFTKIRGFPQLASSYSQVYTPTEKLQCDPHYLMNDLRIRGEQFALDYALQCGVDKNSLVFEPLPETSCELPSPYIIIQSASRVSSKEWSYFPALVETLRKEYPDVEIIQLGAKDDSVIVGALPLLGRPWTQVSYIVRNALMYIGVDSILAHMSAVYDLPCITLYGGTDVAVSRALGKNVVHLSPEFPISDGKTTCHFACHSDCCQSVKCIDTIEVSTVLDHVYNFMEKGANIHD